LLLLEGQEKDMNRREMLLSGATFPIVGQTVATDNKEGVVCFISPEASMSRELTEHLRQELAAEEKRTGFKMVLIPAGAEVQVASTSKYGKSEEVGVWSTSAFAESEESLMRIWNEK
jgi:hypothetical protein